MPKSAVFCLFYLATFLQAGTYGLTFLLPKLFSDFGSNEKHVGLMLLITTATTLVSVYYSGHLTDKIGRMASLAISGFAISIALAMFGWADSPGIMVVLASALLGFGWGTFYSLGPVVMTRITTPDERVRVFSFHSVFIMAGFGLSPVMASTLESFGFNVSHAFYIMAIVCVISGCIFIAIRPAVQNLSTGAVIEKRSRLSLITLLNICKSPAKLPITMVCLGASVFAGLNNFQTVFAEVRALNYADFFLAYTVTVIICRLLLAGFSGGKSPYLIIAGLQYVMFASIVLFIYSADSQILYFLVAILFGIGYGASYPILVAMAANDSPKDYIPQTLQFFALTYFIGIFGFPMIAGWIIVELNSTLVLIVIAVLAIIEATMALIRGFHYKSIKGVPDK